jgi:hypothetical protein
MMIDIEGDIRDRNSLAAADADGQGRVSLRRGVH